MYLCACTHMHTHTTHSHWPHSSVSLSPAHTELIPIIPPVHRLPGWIREPEALFSSLTVLHKGVVVLRPQPWEFSMQQRSGTMFSPSTGYQSV